MHDITKILIPFKLENPKGKCRRWTDADNLLLTELYPNISNRVLAVRFNRSIPSIQHQGFMLKLKKSDKYLKNNSCGKFTKGHTPVNKGTKGLTGANKTSFKKGNISHNTKKNGYIILRKRNRINQDYYYIKIDGKIKPLHYHNFEQKFSKVAEGYILRCKDGNNKNYSPDNWYPVTRKENLKLNRNKEKAGKSIKNTCEARNLRAKYNF